MSKNAVDSANGGAVSRRQMLATLPAAPVMVLPALVRAAPNLDDELRRHFGEIARMVRMSERWADRWSVRVSERPRDPQQYMGEMTVRRQFPEGVQLESWAYFQDGFVMHDDHFYPGRTV